MWCFRAELVLEDIIDYNDLVNSIQDLGDNKQNDKEAIANKDPEPKNGNFHYS